MSKLELEVIRAIGQLFQTKVLVGSKCLTVSPQITIDDLRRVLAVFSAITNIVRSHLPFWVGDLLSIARNQHNLQYSYKDIVDVSPYKHRTLVNLVYMCSRVPVKNRLKAPQEYVLVVSGIKDPDEQERLLNLAMSQKIPRIEFSKLVSRIVSSRKSLSG